MEFVGVQIAFLFGFVMERWKFWGKVWRRRLEWDRVGDAWEVLEKRNSCFVLRNTSVNGKVHGKVAVVWAY